MVDAVSLGAQFSQQLSALSRAIEIWRRGGVAQLERSFKIIGQRVKGEAQKRVPVETNRLKQGLLTSTFISGDEITTEVGTNVKSETGFPYAVVLEFGSRHIAEGRVQALGEDPDITDDQAITEWPAKTKRRAAKQQMPWLRPAWKKVEPEAIKLIDSSFEPPRQMMV